MSIEIIHPGESSLETVMSAVEEGTSIKRSPHVGNVNVNELQLVFGIAEMGGTMQLDMVDSIQGDDNYSSPRHLVVDGLSIPIVSKKAAKGKVVGACNISEEGEMNCKKSDIANVNEGDNVLELHQNALASILPSTISMSTSTKFFSSIGEQALTAVASTAQSYVERPIRCVTNDGSIKQMSQETQSIFGVGEDPGQGALLPLEAMMAVELIGAAMSNSDKIVHVAGPDMIRYTKCEAIMQPVKSIVQAVLAEGGISTTSDIAYVLPCMKELLQESAFPKILPEAGIASQHDVITQGLTGSSV